MVPLPLVWTWTTIAILGILFAIINMKEKKKSKNNRTFPPCPKGLPIIGHLHLLGKNPHHILHKLAKQYGPVMHLKLGCIHTTVVSSPAAAESMFKTHDLEFAGRPENEVLKYIAFGQRNISFAQYGQYWRTMRKICVLQLLSNHKINSFRSMRREELGLFVKKLKQTALDCATIDLSAAISSLSADMSCLMVFGKKYMNTHVFDGRNFEELIQESSILVGTPNLGEFFPFLGRFDLQGITRKSKAIGKSLDDFFEKIILEHEETGKEMQKNNIISTLLDLMKSGGTEFLLERTHVKAIMLDMLGASSDTSATVVEWTISELLKHPQVMKKVRNELEEKVGMCREVEESDLHQLKYLEMAVKEVLRLHPVIPLLLPHEALEDCTIDGFHVPKKSRIIINAWAIGRDPDAWSDPDKFIPERFLERNIDVRGQNFELIPFGSGRRGCPGIQMGLTFVMLVVAQLVHCFDWELLENMLPAELDMTEEFGIVMSRATHLMVMPTYRLQKSKP